MAMDLDTLTAVLFVPDPDAEDDEIFTGGEPSAFCASLEDGQRVKYLKRHIELKQAWLDEAEVLVHSIEAEIKSQTRH
jgi:hypothetical protein